MTHALTPETRSLLDKVSELNLPPLHTLTPAEARQMRGEVARLAASSEVEPVFSVQDRRCGGAGDAAQDVERSVGIRVYEPEGWVEGAGSIAYFHGGGWVLGNLDTHDALCRCLANASGLRVVSTDYRRAPEVPHPAAIDDAWVVTRWLAEEESGPLVVGGDSCGGHIATVVAARGRDSGISIAAQLLIYPVTDLSSFDRPSYEMFAEGYWLTRASMGWFRDHYLPLGTDRTDPEVSPLGQDDLRGLAPVVMVAAQCDVLRDEGEAYGQRLREAGCSVAYRCWEGVIHGFAAMPAVFGEARAALTWAADELQALLEAVP